MEFLVPLWEFYIATLWDFYITIHIEQGAETLKILASKINTDKMKQPSFLMVLTATGNYAYRRKDGVLVVPIGCLRD